MSYAIYIQPKVFPEPFSKPRGAWRVCYTIIDCLLIYDSSFSEAIQVIHLHLLPGYVRDTQVHIPELLVLLLYSFVESPGNLNENRSITQIVFFIRLHRQKNKMTMRLFIRVLPTLMTFEPILKEPVLSF